MKVRTADKLKSGTVMEDGRTDSRSGIQVGNALRSRFLRGVSIAALLTVTACSSVPDYLNPAEWYEDAEDTVTDWFDDDDEAQIATSGGSGSGAAAPSNASDSASYPNLSTVPDAPKEVATKEELEAVRKELAADKDNARYDDSPTQPKITSGTAPAPASAQVKSTPTPTVPAAPAAPQSSGVSSAMNSVPVATSRPEPQKTISDVPASSSVELRKRVSDPDIAAPIGGTASTGASLRSNDPEASALWPNTPAPASANMTGVQSPRIDTRSNTGATAASVMGSGTTAPAAADMRSDANNMASSSSSGPMPRAEEPKAAPAPAPQTSGQDDEMASSQSVIVNPDAIYQNTWTPTETFQAATISFGHGSAQLDNSDRQEIARVAQLWKERGGRVRVVGHSSSRTGNMDLSKHMLANLNVSVKRANNVAAELMRQGVEAQSLIVDARADSEPLFYEVMPAGEAGNRRAEIFIDY